MNFFRVGRPSHHPLAIALTVVLFLIAQAGILWHAEHHPFHEHTDSCFSFQVAEHHAGDLPVVASLPATTHPNLVRLPLGEVPKFSRFTPKTHPPRAPPFLVFSA
jgi:hypothetical protein